jgi:hypothetical protein
MRTGILLSALAAGTALAFLGCPGTGESTGAPDAVDAPDTAAVPSHAFLIVPDTSACQAHVCEVGGDPYSEYKAWNLAHGACEAAPLDLLCRVKSQNQGTDWPAQADARIEAASVAAGGFTDTQKAALRCLAFLEPSQGFNVRAEVAGAGSPSSLQLGLVLDLPGDADAVADAFLARLGPYVGAAYGVTADFDLETKVTTDSGYPWASGGVNIRVIARTYKGIPLRNNDFFEATLMPVFGNSIAPDQPCPGRYRLGDWTNGFFDRRLRDVNVAQEGRVSLDTAVGNALAACGATCWALADARAATWLSAQGLQFEFQVGCPSHCQEFPDWHCTYTVDAFTGAVLGGQEDCCVDCFQPA